MFISLISFHSLSCEVVDEGPETVSGFLLHSYHLCCAPHVSLSTPACLLSATVSLILTPLHHLRRLLFALTFFLLTSPLCRLFLIPVSCLFVPRLVDPSCTAASLSPLHVSTYPTDSCASRHDESSLIGGVSADRLTNSLFINGLSVPGSQRSQRIIQFGFNRLYVSLQGHFHHKHKKTD